MHDQFGQNFGGGFPLYLDHNASNPMVVEVFDAMRAWFLENPGNAGSRTHRHGQAARDAVEKSRESVAKHFDANAEEVIFTSGATESNNLALLGLVSYGQRIGKMHVISTQIEHKAVLEPLSQLRSAGFDVDLAPVTSGGYVDPDAVRNKIRADTLLISVMHSNNETGIIQPVDEISRIALENEIFFHTDAAQTFGKEVPALRALRCTMASASAHKICGPKGIGVLLLRRNSGRQRALTPLQWGGGQERGIRPGTLPVPLIVGFGKAAELALDGWKERAEHARRLRQQLFDSLSSLEWEINGDQKRCQPHVANISFKGIDSEAFMLATRDFISVSNGSACTSSNYSPSHVLTAMGLDEERIETAIRFSWGPTTPSIVGLRLAEKLKTIASGI